MSTVITKIVVLMYFISNVLLNCSLIIVPYELLETVSIVSLRIVLKGVEE